MKSRPWILPVLLLIGACGGGGGGGGGGTASSQLPAPSGLSYPAPSAFEVSKAITAITPTVNGTVSSYAVAPALPAGLSLNTTTGAISGTPTTVAATTAYTVTASNSSGSVTANVSMTVNDVAPVIAYGSNTFNLASGVPFSSSPVVSGGAAVSWSVSPALPNGLAISATNGTISGAALDASSAATYVVTATNSGGSATQAITIAIDSGVLVDLGNVNGVHRLGYSGNRVLSLASGNTWALWNSQTKAKIVEGSVPCTPAITCSDEAQLAGPTLVSRTAAGLEVRASSDGHLIAVLTAPATWWKVATDGSYIVIGHDASLSAWSPSGTQLFSRPGYYAQAKVFAAPSVVRVGAGAAGASVVETVTVATGASTTAPIQGAFNAWFLDGDRFITNLNTTFWIYSAAGVEEDFGTLPSADQLGGQGDYFWSVRNWRFLDIYEVGSNGAPTVANYTAPSDIWLVASTGTLSILEDGQFTIFDLTGGTPTSVTHPSTLGKPTSFGARSATDWLVGFRDGILADVTGTTPEFFSLGAAWDVAASSQVIAVARAAGVIQLFDASSHAPTDTIDFFGSQVVLSADGSRLAALGGNPGSLDRTLSIFDVATGGIVRTWNYASPAAYPIIISLSGSGDVISMVLSGYPSNLRKVFDVASGTEILSGTGFPGDPGGTTTPAAFDLIPRLSPSGSLVALVDNARADNSATRLYSNGALTTAVAGWPVGWLDESRLLVNRYLQSGVGGRVNYNGSLIVDANGQQLQVVTLPELRSVQTVSTDRVYSRERNSIFSLSTGNSVWTSANPSTGKGGVTATHVVFGSGSTVRIEPF